MQLSRSECPVSSSRFSEAFASPSSRESPERRGSAVAARTKPEIVVPVASAADARFFGKQI